MQINKLVQDDRLSQAILGISNTRLIELSKLFEIALRKSKTMQIRERAYGGGRKGALKDALNKLVFILMYCKVYPTFDVFGFIFNINRSQACRWVHKLLPILEEVLSMKMVLPARQVRSIEEFYKLCPHIKDLFIDATERPTQKKVNKKHSNKNYSGKKKACTRKNVVMSDENKRILFLSQTKRGRKHDKKLLDSSDIIRHIPEEITLWGDSGLQGIQNQHENSMLPKKSTKKHKLTDAEKSDNKVISGIRIVIEHAIGGMKRLRCMSDIYRNRTPKMDDKFALLSAGIWNLHLSA